MLKAAKSTESLPTYVQNEISEQTPSNDNKLLQHRPSLQWSITHIQQILNCDPITVKVIIADDVDKYACRITLSAVFQLVLPISSSSKRLL